MLASTDEFRVLIDKFLKGTLSESEEHTLNSMIESSPLHRQTFDMLTQEDSLRKQVQAFDQTSQEWDARETKHINPAYYSIRRRVVQKYWYAAAAVLVIAGLGTAYLWMQDKPVKPSMVATEQKPVTEDVPAGSLKATLTLADRSVIELDPHKKNSLQQGSTDIINEDGQLSYSSTNKGGAETVLMNTLSTPAGGYYRIQLPDGSVAWLNAVSSLQYPTRFTGKERRVKLTGEGYFEVAKDASKPFIVELENAEEIKVLGTKFNIKAYTNEIFKTTTLLEGAVRINNKGTQERVLRPNQRAVFSFNSSLIKVQETDAVLTIAWIKGNFYFDQASLSDVMHQLERWYDISFSYAPSIIDEAGTFQGTIERSWPLSKVLRALERLGNVKFEQQGKKISVSTAMN